MSRLFFPDEGSRLVYNPTTGRPARGVTVLVYTDAGATALASILTEAGGAVPGSALTTDAYGLIPLFQGPNDGTDTLFVVADGGPVTRVYARTDDRLDALATAVAALPSSSAVADAVAAEAALRATGDTNAVATAAADATSKANAAQAAATTAAATDATTKANAAQSAATTAAAADATTKANAAQAAAIAAAATDATNKVATEAAARAAADAAISSASVRAVTSPVAALRARLAAGLEPAFLSVLGDSTGNDSDEWPYLSLVDLAARYPAYSVIQRTWVDASQSWSSPSMTQVGTAGDAYVTLAGGSSSYLSTPTAATLNFAGDIDVRAKIAMNAWTPGSNSAILSKFGSGGNRAWRFYVIAAGNLVFEWTEDGTTLKTRTSTAATGFSPGVTRWIRATLDVDNGASGHTVTFYTSTDGTSWTQLGDPVTTATATSIFATSTQTLEFGARSSGGDLWAGKAFYAEVRNGIGGTIVASPDLDALFPNASTLKDGEGNTWTVNGTVALSGAPGVFLYNAGTTGQAVAYSADVTRFAKQTPMESCQLAFINYGHNEGSTAPAAYRTAYDALAQQVVTKYPDAGVVVMTQNPRYSPATNVTAHAQRNRAIRDLAATRRYGLVDAYSAFLAGGGAALVDTDGIHPLPAGKTLWANKVIDYLTNAA